MCQMAEELPQRGILRGFFAAFQRNFIFAFLWHAPKSIADEITKYGGGGTADHGIHSIKFLCEIRRQKYAKLIVIIKTAKTGKDSGLKDAYAAENDAYAAENDGAAGQDTFSS